MKIYENYKEEAFALLRIVVGLLFISHGIQKDNAFLTGAMPPNILMIIAACIETIGGFLITIGWQTRIAAFIASGEMAVAYFHVHFSAGLLPIKNKGELAVLFCFVFLYFAVYGSGIWSVDNRLRH